MKNKQGYRHPAGHILGKNRAGCFILQKKTIKIIMALLLLAAVYLLSQETAKATGAEADAPVDVILDAGHGGADPGKVAADGTLEKDINLAVAKKVEAALKKQGIRVSMTRETDEMVHVDGTAQEKQADMRLRCEKINTSGARCAVSIHQNSFTDTSASGAQVFYYTASEEGRKFAILMQEELIRQVDPENRRVSKANDSYYLLRRTTIPLLIVECGFMSNPTEAKQLQDEAVQEKLAQAICTGIQRYLEK